MPDSVQTDIRQRYEVLRDIIRDYPGILSAAEPLFREMRSDRSDWQALISELRTHALKNFYLHDHHEHGLRAVSEIFEIFLEAMENPEASVRQAACEGLISYCEKILTESADGLLKYAPLLESCFTRLYELGDKEFYSLVTHSHQIKKLGQIILGRGKVDLDIRVLNDLLVRYFSMSFAHWLKQEDLFRHFKKETRVTLTRKQTSGLEELFRPVSQPHLKELVRHLEESRKIEDQYAKLQHLVTLPGYMQVVKFHEEIAGQLSVTGDTHTDLSIKLLYLLRIMDTPGLAAIHENILREISRTLSQMVRTSSPDQIKTGLADSLSVFRRGFELFPETVLSAIQIIGSEIYRKETSSLVDWFLQKVVSIGFQYPQITGVTDEWQVTSNRAHLQNIRVWLELIEHSPKWSKPLISALIISLRLCGVHISDTDVFQKDVTKLLNSDIAPVYHLIKLLSQIFPVYFSDIGAEGPLREVSTEIDELSHRRDALVHFLRKQSHVESSARVIDFIEGVLSYWLTKDKARVKEFVPDEVFQRIKSSGPYVDDLHTVFNTLFLQKGYSTVSDLLSITDHEMGALVDAIPGVTERERKRACLAVRYYQLLYRKYRLDPRDITEHLQYARSLGLPNTEPLMGLLTSESVSERLEGVLHYLSLLKEIILSPERNEPVENIFRKRHIAAGIPSVYGKYHERKFDALALTFRLENLANVLFEELIQTINLKFITRATLFQIDKYANLFFTALKLDGISSIKLENSLELLSVALEVRRFSFAQYIDIFRGFSEAVQDILNTYYNNIFRNSLKHVLPQIGVDLILPKYRQNREGQTESEFVHQISEQFLRDMVASSFGLQQLDTFISRVLKTLFEQAEGLDVQNLDLLMSYDPKKAISGIHSPNQATQDRIHLGNKGHNLIKLASLGIPVPPGFIITTEVFRCKKAISNFRYVREHLHDCIREHLAHLEKQTGRVFGDEKNPLLVSVRSGGAISMPGMMISFLNVGMNEEICNGLITRTGKPWFVWDCYRRFLQCWGMSFGMERDVFDAIMNAFKEKYHVARKIQFSPQQMRDVALSYLSAVRGNGVDITDHPHAQLETAIEQVSKSWDSPKAQAYREIMGISEHWGTAVIVQAMAYGNLDMNSGTGVLFTHNPQEAGDRVMLWGDFAMGAQGEDIVSGLVRTLAVSNEQRPYEDRAAEITFEDSFPELYAPLLQISKNLIYRERWGAQEIEFTFEGKNPENLFILQTRDMAIKREESFLAFIPSKKLSSSYLSRGIGVGGGALSGRAVFDLDEVRRLREQDPVTPLILIRADTVPDDIRHISAADGLLTARGGSTSHASIIANRLGKTCVVGCNNLIVWEQDKRCRINRRLIKGGDFLSIDGRNGSVFAGRHQTREIKADTSPKW
jgi:pyruvate,orthophosphate dikinase